MMLHNCGTQIPQDISISWTWESSECNLCSAGTCIVLGKYKRPLSPCLIPISLPSDTPWSWKNDAEDSVSRLEEENDEKLDEGARKELGSAVIAAASMCCDTLSLMFIFSSPSGHPLGTSGSWQEGFA